MGMLNNQRVYVGFINLQRMAAMPSAWPGLWDDSKGLQWRRDEGDVVTLFLGVASSWGLGIEPRAEWNFRVKGYY